MTLKTTTVQMLDRIGAIFDDLQRTFDTDPDRPVIEHYRSHTELDLLAPLAGEK